MSIESISKRIITFMFLSVMLVGCTNFFDTRTPEPPAVDGGASWEEPTTYQTVLENLKNAYQEQNETNYARCFNTETFIFVLSEIDIPILQEKSWDWSVEKEITKRIFAVTPDTPLKGDTPPIELHFYSVGEDIIDAHEGKAIVYCKYVLDIHHTEKDKPTHAEGKARFVLKEDLGTGLWNIEKWEDFHIESTDWGKLKASFWW